MAHVKDKFTTTFLAYRIIVFSLRDRLAHHRKTGSRFVISPFALTAASILMSGGAKGGAQRAVRDLLNSAIRFTWGVAVRAG